MKEKEIRLAYKAVGLFFVVQPLPGEPLEEYVRRAEKKIKEMFGEESRRRVSNT